ncbi:hypothetical protein AALA44_03760 [Enterococcus ratti]|uniref:hypothetical protein n=1 Tax=Enterococcus ratti TaxID=150033 RepID=UPI003518E4C9
MEAKIETITVGMLKKQLVEFEKLNFVSDETKILLDTGWDSLQEIAPDALAVSCVQQFVVEDEWTKEKFRGFVLEEKAEKMNGEGPKEQVLVLKNLY